MPVCLSAGLYGAGIYFAEQSCKAAQYSPALHERVSSFFGGSWAKTKVQKANTRLLQQSSPPMKNASAYQDRLGTDHKESSTKKGGVCFSQVMLISRVALGDVSYVEAKKVHQQRRRPPEKKRNEAGARSSLLFSFCCLAKFPVCWFQPVLLKSAIVCRIRAMKTQKEKPCTFSQGPKATLDCCTTRWWRTLRVGSTIGRSWSTTERRRTLSTLCTWK